MKRTVFLTAILAIALLAAASLGLAQVSPPNLIDFQGKLTTPAGNPVADIPHPFIFRIYDSPVGGVLLWSEAPAPITTTGGLFTHQLGSSTPLPLTLFEDYDALWLEVEADAAIITPRTRLISNPYTRVANQLESGEGGVVHARSSRYPGLGGAFYCFDETGNLTIRAEPDFTGNGGFFSVHRNAGADGFYVYGGGAFGDNAFVAMTGVTNNAYFQMSTTGDATALLPADAINAGEMLNEPGIAHSFEFGLITLTTSADSTLDSVSVDVPTAGYVVVTLHCFLVINHVTGTRTIGRFSISDAYSTHDFDNMALEDIHAPVPSTVSDDGYRSFSCTKVEAVAAGTHKYYFIGDRAVGGGGSSVEVARRHLTAMFFPTNYGTVVSAVASKPGIRPTLTDGSDLPPSGVKAITVADHNAQLEAERAKQMADLQERVKKMEAEQTAMRKKLQARDE